MKFDIEKIKEVIELVDKMVELEKKKIETLLSIRKSLIEELPNHFADQCVRSFYIEEKEKELKELVVKVVDGRVSAFDWRKDQDRAQKAERILSQIEKARSVTAVDVMMESVSREGES